MKTLRSLQILEYLAARRHCSIDELTSHFAVSPATMYRNVSELAERGALRRVSGGVVLSESQAVSAAPEASAALPFLLRIHRNADKKEQMAQSALALIEDGEIVFLDSSTSSLYLARALQKALFSNLTVISNSVLIMQEFHQFPAHFMLCGVGGGFSASLNSFLGGTALESLEKLRIDRAFFSAVGFKDDVASTFNEEHAAFLRLLLKRAGKSHLLLDSSKLGKAGLYEICRREELGSIICDAEPPKAKKQ
ncbi:MAG: DeoR/GlpR transcriptional regulator [Lentisphaerae bacterium]|jgi:DeoR/GlpR family transcriptional regulator of sugar metabolism|nr:DeoR/GlpR transcriptional regulator [Lentisphaerota bacterium]